MPRPEMMGKASIGRGAVCAVAVLCGLTGAAAVQAQPRGEARHGGGGFARDGGHGFAAPHPEGRGFAGAHVEGRPPGFAGPNEGWREHDVAGHGPARLHGYAGGVDRGNFGRADWVRGGWHGRGPFLAYAGGRDAWDWRGAWGGGFWGPEFGLGWGGWAWGGIALGAGIGFIVAPPVYVLPPPIYVAPPPVVLGLPAIEPPPIVSAAPPAVAAAPSTADMVAAAVPPPIVVSPPPYVVAEAPPPPVIFAPNNFAFAIAPPVLAFAAIGPAFYSGGYFTGGYLARGYDGGVWDRPYWRSTFHYQRPGGFARVGARVGLGGVFGGERHERFYGPRPGGFGDHGPRGGFEPHRGRERG